MSTPIAQTDGPVTSAALTQLLAVAAVLAAFPAVTLSGGAQDRLKTAITAKTTTPANAQIIDEQGDLLAMTFVTANPFLIVYTVKGLQRVELEKSRSAGF